MSVYDEYDNPRLPFVPLATDRKAWKFYLFGILTLGIYMLIFFTKYTHDLNRLIGREDNDKTWNFGVVWLISYFTMGIVLTCWLYGVTARMERELARREINYSFGTNTFWGWGVLGSLLLPVIGSVIFYSKMFRAMNLMCEDYNREHEEPATKQAPKYRMEYAE